MRQEPKSWAETPRRFASTSASATSGASTGISRFVNRHGMLQVYPGGTPMVVPLDRDWALPPRATADRIAIEVTGPARPVMDRHRANFGARQVGRRAGRRGHRGRKRNKRQGDNGRQQQGAHAKCSKL